MPSDGDAAAVMDRFSKVTTHDFSDKISIKATYYAYYFSWLYSNFSESKSKQALECSIWKTTRLFFLVQLAENNQTSKNIFEIMKTIADFDILLHTCSFEVQIWMQLRSREITEDIFRKLYQKHLLTDKMSRNNF